MAVKKAPAKAKAAAKRVANDFEEDCGFVFRRKTPKVVEPAPPVKKEAPPAKAQKAVATPKKPAAKPVVVMESVNPTPMKKQILERQRRRSSLPGLAMGNGGRRRSSIGIGLTHDLPPSNVVPELYHRHILPDLPGPVKMRQLLIWAVQVASKEMIGSSQSSKKKQSGVDWEEMIAEPMIQALHTNELNASWYQRPASASSTGFRPNPINKEMKECFALHQKYIRQLNGELAQWKALEQKPLGPSVGPVDVSPLSDGSAFAFASPDLVSLNKWSCRLPLSVDRLGWLLNVCGSFECNSRAYCEDVFKQIFDRFFAGEAKGKRLFAAEPINALKALSSAPAFK